MKDKIYISGPMTGYAGLNFSSFYKAEEKLSDKYEVVNPATLSIEYCIKNNINLSEVDVEDFLRIDIKHLTKCKYIYLLDGWEESDGAQFELYVARKIGIKAIHQTNKIEELEELREPEEPVDVLFEKFKDVLEKEQETN